MTRAGRPVIAVFDACVLFPAPLRDALVRVSVAGLCRARWTDRILDECFRNLLAKRPELRKEDLERTRMLMNASVRECLVSGYEHLESGIELPDPDDRHVVAAALHSGASEIVTFNSRDFPASVLDQHDLAVRGPDEFLVELFDLEPHRLTDALAAQRLALKFPPKTGAEFLQILARQGLRQLAERIQASGLRL